MPELPEMQALAERLDAAIAGRVVTGVDPLGFTALKTVSPGPDELVGHSVTDVGRRGKYLVLALDDGVRILVHLSQAGRLDIEAAAKATRPKGSVLRPTVVYIKSSSPAATTASRGSAGSRA